MRWRRATRNLRAGAEPERTGDIDPQRRPRTRRASGSRIYDFRSQQRPAIEALSRSRCFATTSPSGVSSLRPRSRGAILGQADRAAADLRRPGRHRHRERAPVHRAGRRATASCGVALEQQTATSELLKVIGRSTLRPPAGLRDAGRERGPACARPSGRSIFRFDGQLLRVAACYNVSPSLQSFIERNPIAPGRHSGTGARCSRAAHSPHPRRAGRLRVTYAGSVVGPCQNVARDPHAREPRSCSE